MNQRGFTVIELLVTSVILLMVGVVFWTQKNNIEIASRDNSRKVSINAMYYGLEKIYYAKNKAYPRTLTVETLPGTDPTLLEDPNGVKIGEADSDYRYIPLNCTDEKCKSYSLRATLENEADFVKESQN